MLKVHAVANSRSVRVIWLLEELELKYELNTMDFDQSVGKVLSEEHKKRHPLGKVPVLETADQYIWESGAIIQYILDTQNDNGLKPAASSGSYGKYLQWFHYCEGTLMPAAVNVISDQFFTPESDQDPERIAKERAVLDDVLSVIDEELTEDYLIGDFSAADIMIGDAIRLAKAIGWQNPNYTNLEGYFARLESRPAFLRALELS